MHSRKFVRANPHIVDSYFFERVKSALDKLLGPECWDHHWLWFRIEYQTRGTAHAHGCCRLKSDPGLCNLGQKVIQGREAKQLLLASGIRPADAFSIGDKAKDVWAKEFKSKTWTAEQVATMKRHVRGNQSAGCTHSIQRLPPYNDSPTTTSRCQCRPTGQCFEWHCSSMLQGCKRNNGQFKR
jgi:hypothetical protein